MRRLTAAAFVLALVAAPAWADAPVVTATGVQPPQSTATAPPLAADQPGDEIKAGDTVMGACGPTKAKADGTPDSAPHGEVEAGVGTDGFRHLAGTVCKPIGDDGGYAAFSISDTQYNQGVAVRR